MVHIGLQLHSTYANVQFVLTIVVPTKWYLCSKVWLPLQASGLNFIKFHAILEALESIRHVGPTSGTDANKYEASHHHTVKEGFR